MSAPKPIDVLRAYEAWEADLLLSAEAWGGGFPGGMRDLPTFTEPLWDRFMEIQAMRNAAIAAHGQDPKHTQATEANDV